MLFSRNKEDAADEPRDGARRGLLGRLGGALARTRGALADQVAGLLGHGARIDADLLDEIETVLLSSDVGVAATARIVDGLKQRVSRREVGDAEAVFASLREDMLAILEPVAVPLRIPEPRSAPFVILVVGVNGTGKTTTIGKLARRVKDEGRSVMLAAGDTFRAAAIDQLAAWGARNEVPVIAQHTGADSASVIYDACQAAAARGIDVLVADTAGRLHTQAGLMEELRKVRRVLAKLDPEAPHEVLLVLDAGTGQNALAQARQFREAVGVSGVALTKLDGTARGGIAFALAEQLALPIRFVGVGEGEADLREFDAGDFVSALLGR